MANLGFSLFFHRIDFPPEVIRKESLFTNIIVDETTSRPGHCDDAVIYISDTVEPGDYKRMFCLFSTSPEWLRQNVPNNG